jgi:hypothetical protein
MSNTSAVHGHRRPSGTSRSIFTRAAATATATLGLLAMIARTSPAQSAAPQAATWELRFTSGGLVPTGAERSTIKDAQYSAAQVSWLVLPSLAVTSTFGWGRSRDIATSGDPQLDVFTYDLGAEARGAEWFAGKTMTFSPFLGAGAGARSYNYRDLDVDATHNVAAYATAGGELSAGRVGVRLEVRDYVAGFKPLIGSGSASTRNDVVIMVGVRFRKSAE